MEFMELIRCGLPMDDPEDMDTLLEFAVLIRDAIAEKRYDDICRVIRYTVGNSYYEAFCWVLGILEEKSDQLGHFECDIGRTIPDYNEFVARLGVQPDACGNDVDPVRDENGEIQAFFNIIRYKTGFEHIVLVTLENFDARDNDYIQYSLVVSEE